MPIPNEEQTLKMLAREKQYNIRIANDKNNPNYVTERVFINGVCIQIPVGESIEVPETVYKLLIKKDII